MSGCPSAVRGGRQSLSTAADVCPDTGVSAKIVPTAVATIARLKALLISMHASSWKRRTNRGGIRQGVRDGERRPTCAGRRDPLVSSKGETTLEVALKRERMRPHEP